MTAIDNTLRNTTTAPPLLPTTGLVSIGGREGWRCPNCGAGVNPNERTCPCKVTPPFSPPIPVPNSIPQQPYTPIIYNNPGDCLEPPKFMCGEVHIPTTRRGHPPLRGSYTTMQESWEDLFHGGPRNG